MNSEWEESEREREDGFCLFITSCPPFLSFSLSTWPVSCINSQSSSFSAISLVQRIERERERKSDRKRSGQHLVFSMWSIFISFLILSCQHLDTMVTVFFSSSFFSWTEERERERGRMQRNGNKSVVNNKHSLSSPPSLSISLSSFSLLSPTSSSWNWCWSGEKLSERERTEEEKMRMERNLIGMECNKSCWKGGREREKERKR